LGGCGYFPKLTIIKDPLTTQEHYDLGVTYEASGQMDLAEREYRASLPLALGYLALGNLFFNLSQDSTLPPKEVKAHRTKAAVFYRQALVLGPAPAAANNLAWLYLEEGRLLKTAENLALRAIVEGVTANLDPQTIATFKDTLYKIRSAQLALTKNEPTP
jgi:tetratricopeptide (TPR) repeat protein